jgi:hypothetical protein
MSTTNTTGTTAGSSSTGTESGGSAKAAARKKKNNNKKNNKNKNKGRSSFIGSQPEGSVLFKYVIEDNSNQATQLRDLIEILPVFTTIYPLWPSSIRNMTRMDPDKYLTKRPNAVDEGYAVLVATMGEDGKADGGKKVVYTDPLKHESAMDHWKLKVKTETDTMEKYKLNGSSLFEIIRGQLDDPLLGKLAHDPNYQKALISQCPIDLLTLLKSACSLGDGSTVNPNLARLQLLRKSVSFQQKPRHKTVSMETSKYKRTFEVHIDSVMEKCGMFSFGTSWWEPFLTADGQSLATFIAMDVTNQNKYNSLVKDEIIGMLMIEGCNSEGLKNHLKNEYKINGKIDCYPTTSSKAADLIDSFIEVGGSNNNNKNQNSPGNDNDEEQIAGIHATESINEAIDNDTSVSEELTDNTMNAALAAVQQGGDEDPNYYSPLEIDDIDFESEQIAGIHLVDEDDDVSGDESSSNSSSYHLSDHYYCPSDDSVSTSGSDESSVHSSMPGLRERALDDSSSDDGSTSDTEDSTVHSNDDDVSINDSINDMVPVRGIERSSFLVDSASTNCIRVTRDGRPVPSPPVSSIVIPNDQDDVNSQLAEPVVDRIDPAGRVPIRIQQECFVHVDDIVCNKTTLIDIAGEPANNWTQFVETRRSFPTQVTRTHRLIQVTKASLTLSLDIPNAYLNYYPKRVGVIKSRIDPPDFRQGEN